MESSSGHRSSRGGSLAHWLRGLFSADAFGHTKRARRRITGHSSRRLRFESCEDRRLLSIGVLFDSGTGELELTGTSSTDQVSVVGQRNYLDIYVGGTFQARLLDANYNTVSTISFFGGDGDDSLVVQNVQPTGALTIDLTEAENLSVLRSRNVTVTSDAALNLGSASISGTLAITSGGELTQTGQVVVAKETTLDASGNDITLTYAANNFGKAVTIVSAQNVSLRDVNAIVLDDLNVSGDLTIQANLNSTGRTAISQASGTSILVDGATTLTVGPASTVTLKNSGNQLTGTVSFTGATVTLTNDLATELGHSSVTRNLRLTSGGAVTQIDSLIVGQTATISAAGFGIDLSADGNDFRIAALTGADVLINDLNALVLGKSTITGTLDITVDGAITQSSTLTVAGALTLTAGETNNITLTKSSNDFASVEIISACDVALRDKNELELAESIVSGNLTVTTAGDLTQSGILTVNGKTTLTAGSSHDILLATYDNDFGELRIVSGGNVEISDVGELVLGTSRISGTLDVHTDGSLTQSGALTVRGSATLIVDDGDLLLDHASNNFATVSVAATFGNAWLRDSNGMVLGNFDVYGDLTLQANLTSSSRTALSQDTGTTLIVGGFTILSTGSASTIRLTEADNQLHGSTTGEETVSFTAGTAMLASDSNILLGESSATRNLTVTTTGSIAQTGALFVGRLAVLEAATDIVLTDTDNDFATVGLTADTVELIDVNALVLGTSNIGDTLDITTNGSIRQTGTLSVIGATTLAAGEDNDITLTRSTNSLLSVGVLSARNVALRNDGPLDLAGSVISGTLAVTATGEITQSGVLEVSEKTTLTAGGNDITLLELNNFSEISVVSGQNVALTNAEALVLGSSRISGTLDVLIDTSASGGLSQSGAVVVTGATSLDTDANDIELLNTGNNFSTLAVNSHDVRLRDSNGIVLGNPTGSTLEDFVVTGELELTAGSSITQTTGTTITVSGAAVLATNSSANITLDQANEFGEVAVTLAKDVTLNDVSELILGASNITGALTVTAGGDLSQSGALAVDGVLTLNATGFNVDLSTEVDNDFQTLVVSGVDVLLQSSNSIVLADVTATGELNVQSAGSITDSGTVSVDGATTLVAGTDITLDSAASAYDGVLSLQGEDVSLRNSVTTVLGDCTATGDLTVTLDSSDPAATLSNDDSGTYGILIVGGTATLDAGVQGANPAHELDLYVSVDCAFGTLVTIGSPVNMVNV